MSLNKISWEKTVYFQNQKNSHINLKHDTDFCVLYNIKIKNMTNVRTISLEINNLPIWGTYAQNNQDVVLPFTEKNPLLRYKISYGEILLLFDPVNPNQPLKYDLEFIKKYSEERNTIEKELDSIFSHEYNLLYINGSIALVEK
jgi:hypothetical protein